MTETEKLADVVVTCINKALEPRDTKIAALEHELALLKARPLPEHVGSWQDGKTYSPQQMVERAGSCWFALRETAAKPGESDAWRLIAKAGRDLR